MSSDAAADGCPRCGLRFQTKSPRDRGARMEVLLQSNDPPLESELFEIREKVAASSERLSALDTTISEMEDTLKIIRAERESVSTELEELKQVSHPVRRLPSDLLSEMFLACINTDIFHEVRITDSLNIHDAPWVLLRICSRWRGVARSFPRLWSTIKIDLDLHCATTTGSLLLLGLYLQRSGTCSLNIWIQSVPSESIITSNNPILQVLLPSAYRWKFAVIALPWKSFRALDALQGSLESLEALHLDNLDDGAEDPGEVEAFHYVPKLRSLYCFQMWLPAASIFGQRLELTFYQWHTECPTLLAPRHHTFLRHSPLLEECLFDCSTPDESRSGPPLTLYKLRIIDILVKEWGDPRAHTDLCNSLTLPALESLKLRLEDHIPLDVQCLIGLLERSKCRLIALTLASGTSLTDDQLLELLLAAPSLEKLTVSSTAGDCFSDKVIKRLRRDQNAPILPNLKHITLTTLSADPVLFLQMIEGRTQNSTASHSESFSYLESIRLTKALDLSHDLASRMAECCSRGLKFRNGSIITGSR